MMSAMNDPAIGVHFRAFNWGMYTRRKQQGLSQGDLALLVGVHQKEISEIETFRRVPSTDVMEEIADALDAPVDVLFPPAVLNIARRRERTSVRIPVPASVLERLPDGRAPLLPEPAEANPNLGLGDVLRESLAELTQTQRDILIARTGLSGDEPKTLRELGDEYGCTSDNIRQHEAAGLRKMRHRDQSRRLRAYARGGE